MVFLTLKKSHAMKTILRLKLTRKRSSNKKNMLINTISIFHLQIETMQRINHNKQNQIQNKTQLN